MSGILSLIARFFAAPRPRASELPAEDPAGLPVTLDSAFSPIDSNVDTVGWFNGTHATRLARRDSIESNPGTTGWYRKPRFATPDAAAHRISLIGGGVAGGS